MASAGVEALVGVPEGGVDEGGGAGVGGVGVGCGFGASGIEIARFRQEVRGQLGNLLKCETDPALKQVRLMRQPPQHGAEIRLIEALHGR